MLEIEPWVEIITKMKNFSLLTSSIFSNFVIFCLITTKNILLKFFFQQFHNIMN